MNYKSISKVSILHRFQRLWYSFVDRYSLKLSPYLKSGEIATEVDNVTDAVIWNVVMNSDCVRCNSEKVKFGSIKVIYSDTDFMIRKIVIKNESVKPRTPTMVLMRKRLMKSVRDEQKKERERRKNLIRDELIGSVIEDSGL